MEIISFEKYEKNERYYAGNAGNKYGIYYQGENWMIKFPKNTYGMREPKPSYTTSPLSEYIGSHIYESIGIPTHETLLGIRENKLVVACKDFLEPGSFITDFKSIKNSYVKDPELIDGTDGDGTDLAEVLEVIENNDTLKKIEGVKERFWDMFVVDAFISNNDRNNGNWGIVKSFDHIVGLTPVYDNGNSLNDKSSDEQLEKILKSPLRYEDSLFRLRFCTYGKNGKKLNPFMFIMDNNNMDCMKAVQRLVPKMDLEKIVNIIEEIPKQYQDIVVLSGIRKEYLIRILKDRYEKILVPCYEKIKNVTFDLSKKNSSESLKEWTPRL